jgi:hypothetical protein
LGIRAVSRVFAVDPHTVLQGLVEVADHAAAFLDGFAPDKFYLLSPCLPRVAAPNLTGLYSLAPSPPAARLSCAD